MQLILNAIWVKCDIFFIGKFWEKNLLTDLNNLMCKKFSKKWEFGNFK